MNLKLNDQNRIRVLWGGHKKKRRVREDSHESHETRSRWYHLEFQAKINNKIIGSRGNRCRFRTIYYLTIMLHPLNLNPKLFILTIKSKH